MGVISHYQTGIIRHTPEPRLKGLDAYFDVTQGLILTRDQWVKQP